MPNFEELDKLTTDFLIYLAMNLLPETYRDGTARLIHLTDEKYAGEQADSQKRTIAKRIIRQEMTRHDSWKKTS